MNSRIKSIVKRTVAGGCASLLLFAGIANCTSADAFFNKMKYKAYNFSQNKVFSYTLDENGFQVNQRAGLIDDRVPDKDTSVVRLSTGTGFIVDDHTIATAAHCVYGVDNKSFIKDLKVNIYDENCTKILKTITPKEAHIPVYYSLKGDERYDYALLYVEEDLSKYGEFSLSMPMDSFMTSGATVTVSGFPDKTASDPNAGGHKRYKADGEIMDIRTYKPEIWDYQIRYSAFMSNGDSGGPVYTTQTFDGETYHTVVGIHSTSDGTFRCGTRITTTLLMFYYNNDYIGSSLS